MVRLSKGYKDIVTAPHQAFGPGSAPGRDAVRRVTFAVRALVSQMQQYGDSVGHHIGLHRSDLTAMNLISQAAMRGERMSPSDVARQMSLSAAAVTALVDRLEKVGHLERTPDERDRRRVRLDVSEQATGVSRRMFRPLTEQMVKVLEPYSDEELELVLKVITEMTEAVQHADPGTADLSGTPYAERHAVRPGDGEPTLGPHETG
jgi:DNA-binding MarR family transcriptional regulator